MNVKTACLDTAALQRLLAGNLAVAEVGSISAHLESCDRCIRTVRALPEDRLIDAVRAAQRGPARIEIVPLQTLLARMMQLRSGAGTLNKGIDERTLDDSVAAVPAAAPAGNIGRYRILRELGRGGMGTVYEAEDPHLRRRVAVKVPQFCGSAEKQTQMRQRFLREARAAAAVDHPNVCKIYDVGEQDGRPFVVMAFVEGASLADRLVSGRRVKDRTAVTLTARIAEGLLAVHAHDIIHRDLKPGNILMTKDGSPILTDFGLAHVHSEAEHLTGEGALLGTPAYMAPEQAATNLGPVTTRTDLYSLAAVLFQMLTGRLPLEGSAIQIIAHHAQQKEAPPPSQFRRDLDPQLNDILCKAMAFRPEDRYPDVRGFLQALKDWLRRTAPNAEVPVVPMAVALESAAALLPPPLPVTPTLLPVTPTLYVVDSRTEVVLPVPRRRRGWLVVTVLLLLAGGGAYGVIAFRDKWGTEAAQGDKHREKVQEEEKDKKTPSGTTKDDDKKKEDEKKEPPKPDGPVIVLDGDFRKAFDDKLPLPERWTGDAFSMKEDESKRVYLQVRTKTGEHLVMPSLLSPLSGDFIMDGEFQLGVNHTFTIHLEAMKREPFDIKTPPRRPPLPPGNVEARNGEPVDVKINFRGTVSIADDLPFIAPGFLEYKCNTFRIERKNKTLLVYLNGKEMGRQPLREVVSFDALRLGLTAGQAGAYPNARLYKIEILGMPAR